MGHLYIYIYVQYIYTVHTLITAVGAKCASKSPNIIVAPFLKCL